jgi:hypothetical protein
MAPYAGGRMMNFQRNADETITVTLHPREMRDVEKNYLFWDMCRRDALREATAFLERHPDLEIKEEPFLINCKDKTLHDQYIPLGDVGPKGVYFYPGLALDIPSLGKLIKLLKKFDDFLRHENFIKNLYASHKGG